MTEIKTYEDISYEKLHKVKNKLKQKIVQNKIDGMNTLCFVYYAGHGVMDNMTYAVCNQANERGKFLYPLQQQLKALS